MNEIVIINKNIRVLRQILNEDAGNSRIVDAINNHEYIYIYYKGDDDNPSGYRTIRPYVLGTTGAGNTVLRAWQDKGRSVSNSANSPKRRRDHEYWIDNDSKEKSGWRLFRVDRISTILPIGKKFHDSEGSVVIPPKYNEGGDKQMTGGIIAYVKSSAPDGSVDNAGTVAAPKVTKRKVSDFDVQSKKWKDFFDSKKTDSKIDANSIEKLYKIVKQVHKKPVSNYVVFINDKNELDLKYFKDKDTIPKNLMVGNLAYLHDKLVNKGSNNYKSSMDNFKKEVISKLKK